MQHSNKTLAQQVISACIQFQVESVVISPGSRNAPLIIEWNAQKNIAIYSIVDERSAAFFALGLAQEKQKPVALVCSSGSALLNYYPAIAEAYYSQIPLVVLSADRPKHLIDIGDGQTIHQENVYANHIKFSANLLEDDTANNYVLLNKAFNQMLSSREPIHINIPFSEPLYETTEELLVDKEKFYLKKQKDSLLDEVPIDVDELQSYASIWDQSKRKMIIVGVHFSDETLQIQLDHLAKDPSVIILTENTSNVCNELFINSIDQVVFPLTDEEFSKLKPEILLTFGGMIVSKKIKHLLRNNKPKYHWHVDKNKSMDTYHALTHHFPVSIKLFFSQFFFLTNTKESTYQKEWLSIKKQRIIKHHASVQKAIFSDIKVFSIINKILPKKIHIQFSNSSIIRYAQLFPWSKTQNIACNRGTSGIDGSTSTAVGVGVASQESTLLITGDLSFFYDSNALWNQYIPNNFRIILLNNGGGGIFRFIPGPTTTNTLGYFETPHNKTAKQICEMHQFKYHTAINVDELKEELSSFFDDSDQPKLLEIWTPKEQNAVILKEYFTNLNKN
jgi:2-succinyl-5-enolpyruvyl-6-hydroxy-3-cyclohexene-1-carboxylate synthase